MKNKTFIAVVVITLVLIVLTISLVTEKEQAQQAQDTSGQVFLPALAKDINAVSVVEVKQGTDTATMERKDETWRVNEQSGYPADFPKLRQILISLSDLKTIEAKTKKSENYERLGVQEPDAGNNSKQVTIKDNEGTVLASLIIGNGKPGAEGKASLYVRKSNDAQAWLVEGQVNLPFRTIDWLDKSIMDIGPNRIRTVSITQPEGKKLVVYKENSSDSEYKIKDLADGKKLKSPGMINSISGALSSLMLDDVVKAEDFEFTQQDTVTVRYETFDGLVIDAKVMDKDDKTYVYFTPAFDAALVQQPESEVSDPESAQNDLMQITTPAAAQSEAAQLSNKLQPWVYAVPAFKSNHMKTSLEDIVE